MHYTLSFDTSAICCSGIKLLDLLRDQSGVVECNRLSVFSSDIFCNSCYDQIYHFGMDSSGFVSVMGIPRNSNSQRFFRPFTFVSNDQVYTCRTIGHAASVQFELLSVRG